MPAKQSPALVVSATDEKVRNALVQILFWCLGPPFIKKLNGDHGQCISDGICRVRGICHAQIRGFHPFHRKGCKSHPTRHDALTAPARAAAMDLDWFPLPPKPFV